MTQDRLTDAEIEKAKNDCLRTADFEQFITADMVIQLCERALLAKKLAMGLNAIRNGVEEAMCKLPGDWHDEVREFISLVDEDLEAAREQGVI